MMSRESREINVRAVVKLNVETKQYNLLKRTFLSKLAPFFSCQEANLRDMTQTELEATNKQATK